MAGNMVGSEGLLHPSLTQSTGELVRHLIAQRHAETTRRAYRADYRIYQAWCEQNGLRPLSSEPDTVAGFLAEQAASGLSYSTLARRCAAISYAFQAAGLESPTASRLVGATLQGVRRELGLKRSPKKALTVELIHRMLNGCPDTLAGKRDRALLSLGFAAALRRSELTAIRLEDLEQNQRGIQLTIRRSKTDQQQEGQTIAVINGVRLRVIDSLHVWLSASEISQGPIFRAIDKSGRLQDSALSTKSIAMIVKRYAGMAGIDPAMVSAHSLRSGFITSAAETGAALFKIMEVSRHKSVNSVRTYVQSVDRFNNHAAAGFL